VEKDPEITLFLPLSGVAADHLCELDVLLTDKMETQRPLTPGNIIRGKFTCPNRPINTSRDMLRPLQSSCGFGKVANLENTNSLLGFLAVRDRLCIRNLLKRKTMHLDSYACVLCTQCPQETCLHLFFGCRFSQACWNLLNIDWDITLQPL
jgi:hypothetical protein